MDSKVQLIENTKKHKRNKPLFAFLNKMGSALIYPVSILPFAGLILGISVLFDLINMVYISEVLSIFSLFLFDAFVVLVAIAITFKFTKTESGYSVFNATIMMFWFILFQSILVNNSVYLHTDYDEYFIKHYEDLSVFIMSVFGSIILGLMFAFVFNMTFYKKLNLKFLRVYEGPIYSLFWMGIATSIFVLFFVFIWPVILFFLFKGGYWIASLPNGLDTFFYGFLNRILLLFGLHTTLMSFFLYTPVGGVLMQNGEIIATGDTYIWIAVQDLQIPLQVVRDGGENGYFYYEGNLYRVTPNVNPGQYQQGFFPVLIFGFPAAGLAMYQNIEDKSIGRIVLLTSFIPMLTGVTEPFEYLFIFTHPILYFSHAIFTGISFMLLDLLNVSVWLSTGWIFDIILFGFVPQFFNDSVTNYYFIFLVGLLIAPLYYFTFKKFFHYN